MKPELYRPITLDRIGAQGLDVTVEATIQECAALAERMKLPAVHALSCEFHLLRQGRDVVVARGRLHARITQLCVVSLEDFQSTVAETFQIRFVPAGQESDDLDPEADDELPLDANTIDLGEAAAEQLGLALDPYPRMPGASLPEDEAEPAPHPFAALAGLRRPN